MKPERALERARAQLARKRAEGAYDEDLSELRVTAEERLPIERLMEWGVIEPDLDLVTSTRRFGGPIRVVKRTLEHLLRQYHRQLESQQTRFNLHLLTRIAELEDRIADLERETGSAVAAAGRPGGPSDGPVAAEHDRRKPSA